MNRSLIKYLLLILCSICQGLCLAQTFNGPVIEDPFQIELCFDDIYRFYDSPVSIYEQEMMHVYAIGRGNEDDFDDGGEYDPDCSYNDCAPVSDFLLPLCFFIMAYGLWKQQRDYTNCVFIPISKNRMR